MGSVPYLLEDGQKFTEVPTRAGTEAGGALNDEAAGKDVDRHGNPRDGCSNCVIGPTGYWQSPIGAAQEIAFGPTYNSKSSLGEVIGNHATSSLSVRLGAGVAVGVDVIVTPDSIKLFIGFGLGAGSSVSKGAGIKTGLTSGITTKISFNGGFGGAINSVYRISEAGVSPAVTVGAGAGLSVSTLVGYTFELRADGR